MESDWETHIRRVKLIRNESGYTEAENQARILELNSDLSGDLEAFLKSILDMLIGGVVPQNSRHRGDEFSFTNLALDFGFLGLLRNTWVVGRVTQRTGEWRKNKGCFNI